MYKLELPPHGPRACFRRVTLWPGDTS
jgi:hypothetical protein